MNSWIWACLNIGDTPRFTYWGTSVSDKPFFLLMQCTCHFWCTWTMGYVCMHACPCIKSDWYYTYGCGGAQTCESAFVGEQIGPFSNMGSRMPDKWISLDVGSQLQFICLKIGYPKKSHGLSLPRITWIGGNSTSDFFIRLPLNSLNLASICFPIVPMNGFFHFYPELVAPPHFLEHPPAPNASLGDLRCPDASRTTVAFWGVQRQLELDLTPCRSENCGFPPRQLAIWTGKLVLNHHKISFFLRQSHVTAFKDRKCLICSTPS